MVAGRRKRPLTWGSLLVVIGLWLCDRGLQDLTGSPKALISTGRLTGLVASVLMLLQVLLMARIPIVEQAWGQDELARGHRLVGFTSFNLMVAHIVLVIAGYALATRAAASSAPSSTWSSTTPACCWPRRHRRPGDGRRDLGPGGRARRLRYESWHLLHLYAYLGVGLALPHQLWTGADFIGSTGRDRLLVDAVRRRRRRGARLPGRAAAVPLAAATACASARRPEAPGRDQVHLTGRTCDRLAGRGGQFFAWRFLDGPRLDPGATPTRCPPPPTAARCGSPRPRSATPSSRLATLRPGTRVLVEGPYGRLHAA